MTLGQMCKKVIGSYLAIDLMLLFINLPFNNLVVNIIQDSKKMVTVTPKPIPCIVLGFFTLIIFFALMVGYMGPVGEKIKSPTSDAPVDKLLALKAAAICFALPFLFGVFTSLSGAGLLLPGFYDGMKFVFNLFFAPVFGFTQIFYNQTWLYPIFPALIMPCVIQLAYWIIIKGFKLPSIFYRDK